MRRRKQSREAFTGTARWTVGRFAPSARRHVVPPVVCARKAVVEQGPPMPIRPRAAGGGVMSIHELYLYFLYRGELWKFFSMFPVPKG